MDGLGIMPSETRHAAVFFLHSGGQLLSNHHYPSAEEAESLRNVVREHLKMLSSQSAPTASWSSRLGSPAAVVVL